MGIVLDKDDGKILLLSKYVLDCQVYNDSYVSTDWKSCSLRRWLNNTFFSNAFTKEEAQIVLETVVSNSIQEQPEKKKWQPVACADTKDKVFPLSFREYSFYLPYDFATRGTAYAEKKGSKGVFWDKEATQATRSSGKNAKEYTYMYATEDPSSCSVDLKNGIRPAIWIDSLEYNKGNDMAGRSRSSLSNYSRQLAAKDSKYPFRVFGCLI